MADGDCEAPAIGAGDRDITSCSSLVTGLLTDRRGTARSEIGAGMCVTPEAQHHTERSMTHVEEGSYDVLVVGGGPVGETVAARVSAGGLTVALVEAELLGGECVYWACIPSKALLHSVHALRAARRLPGSREAATGQLDVQAVFAHRDDVTYHHDDSGQSDAMASAGVTVIRGHGRLDGRRRVMVTTPGNVDVPLEATHAVILATGSTAAVPSIPGLREASPWTSRNATSANAAPRRLVIMGGGPVGVEMAQAWRALGSEQVILLQSGSRLLPRLEPFAGERLLAGLRADDIDVRLGSSVVRVDRSALGGELTVHLAGGSTVVGDELLVATGRQPATVDLGLHTIGLEPGAVVGVDGSMQVDGMDWLYAVGDVNGRALLTHQGKYQARVAADALLARSRGAQAAYLAEADTFAVPQVIFTDPEIATVGLTGALATERGMRVRTVEYEFGIVPGAALEAEGYSGRAALVVNEDDRVIVGATFVGPNVADMLHAATIAIVGRVPLELLRHAVPSFPTKSEIWLMLIEEYGL
jgi:pyruvate/2-oxoglutarate dehydrogenase complex dihydrolipoamide dehydrogenase (E3) component